MAIGYYASRNLIFDYASRNLIFDYASRNLIFDLTYSLTSTNRTGGRNKFDMIMSKLTGYDINTSAKFTIRITPNCAIHIHTAEPYTAKPYPSIVTVINSMRLNLCSPWGGSNTRHMDLQSTTLPTELQEDKKRNSHKTKQLCHFYPWWRSNPQS